MIPVLLAAILSVAGMSLPLETLAGDARVFPRDASHPRAIFVVTFSRSASEQGSRWTRMLGERSAELGPVYQVAVLENAPRFVRALIISGIRREVPSALHDRFWIAASGTREWRECAGAGSTEGAHVFVLDHGSRIVWRTHGGPSEAKLREILTLQKPTAGGIMPPSSRR